MAVNKDNLKNLDDTEDISKLDDEKELEKYGVWVKTGPEEINDIYENIDFNLSDLEEEAVITDEEEEMLGDLEKELALNNNETDDNEVNLTDTVDDIEDNLDLEEIELDEFADIESSTDVNSEDIPTEDSFDLDIDFEDDLTLLEEEPAAEVSDYTDTPVNSTEDIADMDLEDLELEDLDIEDLELDEDLSLEPEKSISPIDEDIDMDMDVLLDIDNMDNLDDLDVDLLLEEDSDTLLSDDSENPEITDISNSSIEFSEFDQDLDELEEIEGLELDEEKLPDADLTTETNVSKTEPEEDFDETEKIIEDLTEMDDLEEPDAEPILYPDNANSVETGNIASEILKKIEQELLSIKNELRDVKKELSTLRPDGSKGQIDKENILPDDEPGFFEDDEDETIALTGDELDNILNTADIIEETGSESESPEVLIPVDSEEEVEIDNLLADNEDIITIEEDGSIEDLEIESIDEEIIPDTTENLDFESVEETADDDIIELDIFNDTESNNESTLEDEISLDLTEDIIEEEIDLDDLDNEDIISDLEEPAVLDEDIDFNIDNVEEINETIPVIETLEEEIYPIEASEPDGISVIDMELPEMQEESLSELSPQIKTEIKSVLSYMDQLLESLPEEKIDEFANSEHYEVYKKLFEELGLN